MSYSDYMFRDGFMHGVGHGETERERRALLQRPLPKTPAALF